MPVKLRDGHIYTRFITAHWPVLFSQKWAQLSEVRYRAAYIYSLPLIPSDIVGLFTAKSITIGGILVYTSAILIYRAIILLTEGLTI